MICENYENHEKQQISYENHENHEKHGITLENQEIKKILKFHLGIMQIMKKIQIH